MRFLAALLLVSTGLGAAPVPSERYAHLARGVNLTRWFQYGSYIPIDEPARDMLREAGFNAVRIPVAPQYLLGKWATQAEIAQNLARLDRGIDMFLTAGMSVTLDFQADTEYLDYFFAAPGAAGELVETWRMLAARYANRDPELLFFEIMNEPDTRFTQASWDLVQRGALAAIRSVAPNHTVLLAPVNWSGLDGLLRMTPYDAPNVIYEMHYYSPFTFTHQGANWTGQPEIEALHGVPWPTEDWDREDVAWDMHLAGEWARQWNVSVIVNEFGAYKRFTAPEFRTRWLHDVRSAIEKEHLAWAVWDYAAGFDVTETVGGVRRIDPAVRAALGLSDWKDVEPARSSPLYSAPLTVQIGAQTDIAGPAFDIDASGSLVVVTSVQENPVQLFRNDGHGILRPVSFDGPAPVVASAPIVVGKLGYFFPGAVSRLVSPSLKEIPLPPISATGAIAYGEDFILFGAKLRTLHHPNAFPADAIGFSCGVIANGILTVFGQHVAATYIEDGNKFRLGKKLTPVDGLGSCTAVANLVAWTNDTIDVLDGPQTSIPLPSSKWGVRRIALNGDTLVVTRPSEAPLLFHREADGTYAPLYLKPANNLSVVAPVDLNNDGLMDFLYAQGGNAPLIGRFAKH